MLCVFALSDVEQDATFRFLPSSQEGRVLKQAPPQPPYSLSTNFWQDIY